LLVALFALVFYVLFIRLNRNHEELLHPRVGRRLSARQWHVLYGMGWVVNLWILAYILILGPLHNQLLVRTLVLIPIFILVLDIASASPDVLKATSWTFGVLSMTLVAAIAIRASSYFDTTGMIGVDPWLHLAVSEEVVASGSIPATVYGYFPLFHVLTSAVVFTTGTDVRLAMFIAGSVLEAGTLVVGYLLFRLFVDRKVALLSGLIVGFSAWNLHWGFWVIGMTLAIPLFWGAFWTFLTLAMREKSKAGFQVAFLVFATGVILSHPIASLLLATLLGVSYVLLHVKPVVVRTLPRLTTVALIWILVFGYWLYVSGSFSTFVAFVRNSLTFDQPISASIISVTGTRPLLSLFWDRLPSYFVEFLAIPGFLFGLERRSYRMYGIFGLVGFVTTGLSLALQQTALFAGLPDRLLVFGELLLAPSLVLGAYMLAQLIHNSSRRATVVVAVLVLAIFASLANYQAAASPILLNESHPPAGLSLQELSSLVEIRGFSNATIVTDPFSASFLHWTLGARTDFVVGTRVGPPDSITVLRIGVLDSLSLRKTYETLDPYPQAVRFYDSGSTLAYVGTS